MRAGRVVTATEFKAKCLNILDEIAQKGSKITVTRRGRPIAVVGPAPADSWKSPENSWAGKITIVGDIVDTEGHLLWEVTSGENSQPE